MFQVHLEEGKKEFELSFSIAEPPSSELPFTIEPQEAEINGKESKLFQVSFSADAAKQHRGVLQAYPKLEDGTILSTIPLEVFAKNIDPQLYIDKRCREDGFVYLPFTCWAVGGPNAQKTINLTNLQESVFSFNLETTGPYIITTTRTSASQMLVDTEALKSTRKELNRYTLAPRDNIEISLKFIKPSSEEWPVLEEHKIGGELLICYTNGHTQEIRLETTVHRPWIRLTSDQMYESRRLKNNQWLGWVHLDQNKRYELNIGNESEVEAKWKIRHCQDPPEMSEEEEEEKPEVEFDLPEEQEEQEEEEPVVEQKPPPTSQRGRDSEKPPSRLAAPKGKRGDKELRPPTRGVTPGPEKSQEEEEEEEEAEPVHVPPQIVKEVFKPPPEEWIDDPSVFSFISETGTLNARTTTMRCIPMGPFSNQNIEAIRKPNLIQVTFKPKEAVGYKSTFEVEVEHGNVQYFTLFAAGTDLDEDRKIW